MTVAIIRFPGSNCEQETLRALTELNINATIIDWTQTTASLNDYSGFIIPGGFSFQDRVRAGVIAAQLPIIDALKDQAINRQKPVLGICNGAQILVESGILSIDTASDQLDAIIDANYVDGYATHFLCDWAFVKPFKASQCMFLNQFSDADIIPIQVCHGEGRYLLSQSPTSGMNYCTIDGTVSDSYPVTPNGSQHALAAISNQQGNVFAIMPHPERSINQRRLPFSIQHKIATSGHRIASWKPLFQTFKEGVYA